MQMDPDTRKPMCLWPLLVVPKVFIDIVNLHSMIKKKLSLIFYKQSS